MKLSDEKIFSIFCGFLRKLLEVQAEMEKQQMKNKFEQLEQKREENIVKDKAMGEKAERK